MTMNALDNGVIAKLDAIAARYQSLTDEMNDAAVAGNGARMVQLSREHARLRRVVEPYARLRTIETEIRDTRQMLDDPATEADLRRLAESELADLLSEQERINEGLLDHLLAGDEADVGSVILELRAGTGGEEAALFVRDLLKMYEAYATSRGLKCEVLDVSPTDLGGFREVIVNVRGPEVYQLLGYEAGGHRVQRVPQTEAQGRIHTSAATVAVLPDTELSDVQIDWDRDVIEHVSCAGGPGGQNVNKVASAIRLEHKATGITVSMRDERSQHKNRDKARRIMAARVRDHIQQREQAELDQKRRSMIGSGDRNERIRTYNFPQNRCTDHRINENYSLDRILAGDLDELLAALRRFDRQQRIKDL
jgi:peptide chain release factor 1